MRSEEASIVGFIVFADPDAIPLVWECLQESCPIVVSMEGLRVVKIGHITCLRCKRPMRRTGVTLH